MSSEAQETKTFTNKRTKIRMENGNFLKQNRMHSQSNSIYFLINMKSHFLVFKIGLLDAYIKHQIWNKDIRYQKRHEHVKFMRLSV